ncbi:MAG: phosphatidylserine decarboxylase family protein [Bacteroidetes bacterium]|nr:phosphatidylserine decarboxylase family protein [Bacteroidota bacterium]MBP6314098.1 phosphatidylserine decarboxylase family protein [Chitinophagaceae bacterium]
MTIHKEGHMYCLVSTILYAVVCWLCLSFVPPFLAYPILFILGLLWFWVFWFFRIPSRTFTTGEQLIISPCDGKVVVIEETTESEYFKDKRIQVSIFMSPLNVHVNRYPLNGTVSYAKYHKGKYLVAWHPKSSTENERTTIVVKNSKAEILIRQIAGAVARRIVMYSKEGDVATQNGELGFIKFGSRVDLFLPIGTKINAKIGDVVEGGIDVIATFD